MAGNLSMTDKCDGEHAIFLRASPFDELRAASTPDFSDPATLGCLLALVREKWGAIYTKPEEGRWTVRGPTGHIVGQGPTEAEALVAALEVQNG